MRETTYNQLLNEAYDKYDQEAYNCGMMNVYQKQLCRKTINLMSYLPNNDRISLQEEHKEDIVRLCVDIKAICSLIIEHTDPIEKDAHIKYEATEPKIKTGA
jgi:hypothetical protein